ncbi:MAG: type II toxin-antitoxin system HicB family antitoxin [Burkholderiales bacterium]|nr:type II toxin-antitoxin system HicB family antitoxin [Burkholderiales bacterium]
MTLSFTALVHREGDWYVALCPELDVASQGRSFEDARANLAEAVTLLLECSPPEEIEARSHLDTWVTRVEVEVG